MSRIGAFVRGLLRFGSEVSRASAPQAPPRPQVKAAVRAASAPGPDSFEPASGMPTRDPRLLFRGPPRRASGVDTFERVPRPPVALGASGVGEAGFLASADDLPVLDDASAEAPSGGANDFLPSLDDLAGLVGPGADGAAEAADAAGVLPDATSTAAPPTAPEAGDVAGAMGGVASPAAATAPIGSEAADVAGAMPEATSTGAAPGAPEPVDAAANPGAIARRTAAVAQALFGATAPTEDSAAGAVAARTAVVARALFGDRPPEPPALTLSASEPTPSP